MHVVYVDDEHIDDGNELTLAHFAQFGRHCVPGEDGYLGTGETAEWRALRNGRTHVVKTPGLNDNMYGTGFIPVLTAICQEAEEVYGVAPGDIRILNIGGWSIIKVLFCGCGNCCTTASPTGATRPTARRRSASTTSRSATR